ncbi:hypothetical protein FV242_08230 [Methylobacterium sp. WL64]|uniref:helix-turn-helix transcriptional regulator n=1 Tax=Methylobacterium sp. WL64 TaxID=2603894 RepID=UPI0011C89883|nr:hypothetical protein [Methylobacterium sp. WL64]TXN04192.1 hypothetical protein FV242_08230 [Methylobacterium sp. WL64]
MTILQSLPPDIARRRIIGTRDAAAYCGVSEKTFRRMQAAGTIPEPLKLSIRKLGWRIGDLLDWQDCRQTGRAWKDCQGVNAASTPA